MEPITDDSLSTTSMPSYDEIFVAATLNWIDIVVVVVYIVVILFVGYWSSRKSRGDSVDGYFLADKSMHWALVGASLFSSNIGSGSFIGLAGSGADNGIAVSGFELHAMFVLILLGWIFVPVYLASGVNTMPEYLKLRFGGQRIRIYLSVLTLLLCIFIRISADLYAGAIFIKQSLNFNLYLSVGVLLAISAVFTIGGGLTAVMWTDFVQTILMIGGALLVAVLTMIKVGGYQEILNNFGRRGESHDPRYISYRDNCTPSSNTSCTSCSEITPYYNHLFRPINDPDYPITGIIFGLTISAVWHWCTDQVIVQRTLSSKNISHAKCGCIMASYLKILPLYLMVLPGMAARMLWPDLVGCSNPIECKKICGSESGCTNIAYPLLVLRVLPTGATGLMLSVMMAALMSSLTSIFNSTSTIFSIDIWTRIRQNATEVEQVIVGRIFVLILVVISILWIPIIESTGGSQLFVYTQTVTSCLSPPICAIYVLALLWSRVNECGAFWALMCGLAIGVIRFIMEFAYTVPLCGSDELDLRPAILSKVHYLHFGCILFVIVFVLAIVISLATEPIHEKHLYRLTFWTRFNENVRKNIDSENDKQLNGISNIAFVNDVNNTCATNDDMDLNKFKTEQNSSVDIECGDTEKKKSEVNEELNGKDSRMKKYLYSLCCMSKQTNNYDVNNTGDSHTKSVEMSEEERAKQSAQSIVESENWKNVNDISVLLLVAIAAFFWGFYA